MRKLLKFCLFLTAPVLFVYSVIRISGCIDVERLAQAAETGDVKRIDELLKRNVDVNAHSWRKPSPLFRSFQAKNKEGFAALLSQGAEPNWIGEGGITVMHFAAHSDDSYWLQKALKYGGNPNLVNTGSPRHKNQTPIFWAILQRNKLNIELLVNAGANLDHQDALGTTPLLQAHNCLRYDIVLDLLESGADYRVKDNLGDNLVARLSLETGKMPFFPVQEPWLLKVADFVKKKGALFDFAKEKT